MRPQFTFCDTLWLVPVLQGTHEAEALDLWGLQKEVRGSRQQTI